MGALLSVVVGNNYDEVVFKRLSEIDEEALIELMNDPAVRRHLLLAKGYFGQSECREFVAAKERMWTDHGYGPWAFVLGEELVGWGGIQPESGDVDVGMVLHRRHWGAGKALYERIVQFAFGDLGFQALVALLPESRTRTAGLLRLGFRPDGEVVLGGERFLRYRLTAPAAAE